MGAKLSGEFSRKIARVHKTKEEPLLHKNAIKINDKDIGTLYEGTQFFFPQISYYLYNQLEKNLKDKFRHWHSFMRLEALNRGMKDALQLNRELSNRYDDRKKNFTRQGNNYKCNNYNKYIKDKRLR